RHRLLLRQPHGLRPPRPRRRQHPGRIRRRVTNVLPRRHRLPPLRRPRPHGLRTHANPQTPRPPASAAPPTTPRRRPHLRPRRPRLDGHARLQRFPRRVPHPRRHVENLPPLGRLRRLRHPRRRRLHPPRDPCLLLRRHRPVPRPPARAR